MRLNITAEWYEMKYEMNKSKVKLAITRQLEWFEFRVTRREISSLENVGPISGSHFLLVILVLTSTNGITSAFNDSKPGGHIYYFWTSILADEKTDFKRKVTNAKFCEIQLDGFTTPSLGSPIRHSSEKKGNPRELHPLEEGSPIKHLSEEENPIIIDDIPYDLSFENEDSADYLHVGEINVAIIFRNYQNQSLNIARDKGLFVESNVQKILSLSEQPLRENLGFIVLDCLRTLPSSKIRNEHNYKVDYYIMDLVKGIYIILHVCQMSIPASLKDMSSFVDDIELSLRIQDIFRESYENFYPKLCNPDPVSLTEKATFKKKHT
ncbi:4029_t:CDS:2 [Gigaspora margarita]|uniref:4029_t:CDS:1 n=1 Tax=Gigaspora margarita TaxID=4874 RepID=A0ABN7UWS2_GIGMA|nr:4029_t:CDS:2 [Gigaspora margarita]